MGFCKYVQRFSEVPDQHDLCHADPGLNCNGTAWPIKFSMGLLKISIAQQQQQKQQEEEE